MSKNDTIFHTFTSTKTRLSARISRGELAWLPVVLAAILVIYLPGLGNAPVADDGYLTDGSLFSEYRSPFALHPRMLSYGTFVWAQALWGEGWWKQRLVNIAIHIGVVVALWGLYRAILSRIEPPADDVGKTAASYAGSPALGLAIGFYALNPMAVYAVAYLIQRSILLATFFVVTALWLFAKGLIERKWAFHALALASYTLAVMSKEHAILAPIAAIPIYIVVARPSGRRLA